MKSALMQLMMPKSFINHPTACAAFSVGHDFLTDGSVVLISDKTLPSNIVWLKQVHSNKIETITSLDEIPEICGKEADGLVTNLRRLVLSVHTADCASVALVDDFGRGICLLHCGWRGIASGILENGLTALMNFGISQKNIFCYIGPAIGVWDYEVGEEFRKIFPKSVFQKDGKTFCDLAGEIVHRLKEFRIERIEKFPLSTFSTPGLQSFRRDGDAAGRITFYMWMR